MLLVYSDLDEHVQRLDHGLVDRHQAGVPVVDQEVTLQLLGRQVVDATRPVGHVSRDDALRLGELLQDVRDQKGEHQQAFRELQHDLQHPPLLPPLLLHLPDPPDALLYFEVVVLGQGRDGYLQGLVVTGKSSLFMVILLL